tara:strand:+ start:916 stop:1077 length:162 start_codon:yes stop_codon:yes gene_type:complete
MAFWSSQFEHAAWYSIDSMFFSSDFDLINEHARPKPSDRPLAVAPVEAMGVLD